MRSLPFRMTTEKGETENHTGSASPKTQPDLSGSHVNNQDKTIDSPSTPVQLEQDVITAIQEKSKVQVNSNDYPEYPYGLKLATITVAVAVSVFLVALVCSSFFPPAFP
jgi:hypothetical protein